MAKSIAFAVFAAAITSAALPAHGVNVALFNNTTYVDYIPGNPDSEASNLQATLQSQGSRIMTFSGITAADFTAAVAGKNILAIPELETSDLNPDLDAAARTAIFNFVDGGGILLMFDPCSGDPLDVLNATFGFSLSCAGGADTPITLNATAAAGTPFAGGPATIPQNDATASITAGSLPAGARIIYIDNNGNSTVTLIPVGSGFVVVLGWDWYDAVPVGSQDGGWLEVLRRATGQPAVPAPALSYPVMGMVAVMLLGFGAFLSRRRNLRVSRGSL